MLNRYVSGKVTRFLSIFIFTLVLLAFLLPYPLVYSEKPIDSDAIMVFIGPVNEARQRYAQELMQHGYGQVVLIPAYGKIIDMKGKVRLFKETQTAVKSKAALLSCMDNHFFCKWIEDTHIEIIKCKRMMEALGLHSVIFVSSPYHMRRIQIIAHRVFDSNRHELHFAATPYGPQPLLMWWADRDQRWWVFNEWIKLIWFIIYAPFCIN